jgi:spore coat protein CotF
MIQSFKRGGEKNALALNQAAQPNLKQVYNDIDSRLRLYYQEISKPVEVTRTAIERGRPSPYSPYEVVDVQQKKMIKSSLTPNRGRCVQNKFKTSFEIIHYIHKI